MKTLSLPAAHATVQTWTEGFGFKRMGAEQLLEVRESLRLLVFPGTEILHKPLIPGATPGFSDQQPRRRKEEQKEAEGEPPNAGKDADVGNRAASEVKADAEGHNRSSPAIEEPIAVGVTGADGRAGVANESRAAEGADGAAENRPAAGEAVATLADAQEPGSAEPMDIAADIQDNASAEPVDVAADVQETASAEPTTVNGAETAGAALDDGNLEGLSEQAVGQDADTREFSPRGQTCCCGSRCN